MIHGIHSHHLPPIAPIPWQVAEDRLHFYHLLDQSLQVLSCDRKRPEDEERCHASPTVGQTWSAAFDEMFLFSLVKAQQIKYLY